MKKKEVVSAEQYTYNPLGDAFGAKQTQSAMPAPMANPGAMDEPEDDMFGSPAPQYQQAAASDMFAMPASSAQPMGAADAFAMPPADLAPSQDPFALAQAQAAQPAPQMAEANDMFGMGSNPAPANDPFAMNPAPVQSNDMFAMGSSTAA